MASNLLPEKLVTTEIQARSFLVSWPCQVSEYDKKVVFQLSRSDHQLSDYIIVYSGAAKLFLVDNLIPLTTYILKLKIKFHDQDDDQWSLNFITTQTTTIDETELQKAYLEITRCLNDFQKGAVNLQAIVSKYGAQLDLNTRDKSGKTFLMVACQSSSKEVVSVLLKNGAFHDLYSKSGKSPLSIAVTFGNIRAVELLIEAGADVDVQDNGGSTPLMWACESIEIMEYLIQHGANIKKEDLFFRNAFDRLCAVPPNSNSVKAAKLLIKSGCTQRLMCSDKLPNTSLMLATINGNRELVKFLIEEGADYSAKTSHGLTAVDMAMTSSKLIYDYFKSLK